MVRVSHDGSGHTPAWFLEEIRARQKVSHSFSPQNNNKSKIQDKGEYIFSKQVDIRRELPQGVAWLSCPVKAQSVDGPLCLNHV